MAVEIRVPRQPIALRPGEAATVPVELTSASPTDLRVRLSVVGGRAASWAAGERTVALPAGGSRTVDLAVQPPADAAPSTALLPFTVRVDDLDGGVPLGRATGLVTLAAPESLRATLHRTSAGRPAHFTLTLRNPGTDRLPVAIAARLHPSGGRVLVRPEAVDVPAGGSATAHVEVRPPALLVGGTIPYAVTLSCRDARAAADAPALATVEEGGQSPPRVGRAVAAALTALLVVVAVAAALLGGWSRLTGRQSAAAEDPDAEVRVRAPYAYVQAFPRGGTGPADADATLARLTAAGIPVRLVDSTRSPDLADGPDGLLVLLQDGFASAGEAQTYCDQHRALAPRCQVVS
ncbi:hypothetical protein WEI85_25910 [Actinomycetes bacterium KLBMP 9797]